MRTHRANEALVRRDREEHHMGVGDKFSNKAEELGGRAKKSAGPATGDRDL